MSAKVELYDSAYANYGSEVYRQVRLETYGQDFGQTSWVSNEESDEIPQLLKLESGSSVLELGCGSGGYAMYLAEKIGCKVVGLDVNASGIENGNQLASARRLEACVHFLQHDASTNLAFDDNSFDALFSNDVLCHVPGRAAVLRQVHRVLKPGGRLLFSDALVVGGMVTHEEIAIRSSIGFYAYSPPGENERLIEQAGLRLIKVTDTTENAAQISARWLQARERKKTELISLEGLRNFEGLQAFLSCVHALTNERRLLRKLYLAEKAGGEAVR